MPSRPPVRCSIWVGLDLPRSGFLCRTLVSGLAVGTEVRILDVQHSVVAPSPPEALEGAVEGLLLLVPPLLVRVPDDHQRAWVEGVGVRPANRHRPLADDALVVQRHSSSAPPLPNEERFR